jgi:hypothetical protein
VTAVRCLCDLEPVGIWLLGSLLKCVTVTGYTIAYEVSLLSAGLARIRIVSGINKTANVRINVNNDALSSNYFCLGIAKGIEYAECGPAALVIQQTMRMRLILLPCVTRLAVPYFTTLC